MVCNNCHAEIHAQQREAIRLEEYNIRMKNMQIYEEKHGTINTKSKLSLFKSEILQLVEEGACQQDIAKELGLSLSSLKKYLQRHHIKTTHTTSHLVLTKETLIEDFKELGSFRKVGEKYHVSDNAIRKHCKKLKLPTHTSDMKLFLEK